VDRKYAQLSRQGLLESSPHRESETQTELVTSEIAEPEEERWQQV
jgi:hypothetical protein